MGAQHRAGDPLGNAPTLDQIGDGFVGQVIAGGKYQIVQTLGQGGMGAVYQALQPAMNRMVALKLIRPEMGLRPENITRFQREMMVTARIEHPNTIRLYDFGEDNGQLYLVMELLQGQALGRVIDRIGKLDLARIVRIGRQVANALGAVHAHGVVHRDLKPDNVMLLDAYGERDFVKVLDFGIAKSLDEDAQLTGTGKPIGTPAYMSPEQALGRPVDHRTDLYALGVMLYRMASGRAPFEAPTAVSMLLAHASEPPPPVLELAPELLPSLAQLIMQLIEKDPAARPQNAAEVVARLDACLPGALGFAQGSLAPPSIQPGERIAVTGRGRSGPQPAAAAAAMSMTARPRRLWLWPAAGAVIGAGGLVAYLGVRQPETSPAPPTTTTTTTPTPTTPAVAVTAAPVGLPNADRAALDNVLGVNEPLAPEACRATEPSLVSHLLDAARATTPAQVIGALGDRPGASAEAWTLLSRAQLGTSAEQAQASATEAVRLCPGYAVAHNVAGNALQKLDKFQLAEDAYVRALTAAPMYDAPRFNLGLLQLRQNDATAIGTFTELLRRRPDHPNAHLARAQAYAANGKPEEALADLEEELRRAPDNAEAWALLGELRDKLKLGDANAAYCRAAHLGHSRAATLCKT